MNTTKKWLLITIISVAIVTIAIGGVFVYYTTNNNCVIVGPTEAQVGELVILEVTKTSSCQWKVIPDNDNYVVIDNKIIFSAVETGEYTFICATVKNNTITLLSEKLVVIPYTSLVPKVSLKELVLTWLPNNYDKVTAAKLAVSLKSVVDSNPTTIEDLILKSAKSNRDALGPDIDLWKPFLVKFSEYCRDNLTDKSLEEHIAVWEQVSEALANL